MTAPAPTPDPRRARKSRRRWTAAFIALWSLGTAFGFAAILVLALVQDVRSTLPPVPHAGDIATSPVVLDRNGLLLRPFTIGDGRWRLPVTRAEVDPLFFEMLLAYEDRRFYDHAGVDWSAMVRAAVQYAEAGAIVSGGSTITMQVARLLDGGDTRNLSGKLRQIVFAQEIDSRLSKDEILDLYLTLAPYGGNLEGIRAATLAYFGKEPARLTPAEAALLVALPQSPEARRPDRDPVAARAARDRVLDRMVLAGVLIPEEAEAAKSEDVPAGRRPFPIIAAHLAEAAILADPAADTHRLTIDRTYQLALERLAADRAAALGQSISVAIVLADHRTGEILASVGSAGLFSEGREGFVDMTRAIRSPGSTLKPFIYGLAFEMGLAHPESLIEDRPTGFGEYNPVNFDGFYRGTVTIREALQQSLNVPAVIVLDAVGPAQLVARLRRSGASPALPSLTAPGLAIGLGGVGITLRDLVGAYAAIANRGTAVLLTDGVTTAQRADMSAQVLDPAAAWYVTDILAGVLPPSNGSAGRVAYKTGTSYGYRDAWAIGFDGRYVVGVWVGRPDGAPIPGLSGIGAAAPILFESFDRLGGRTEPLPLAPAGAIVAATAELPEPLRRFRHTEPSVVARNPEPEITFPPDGVRVDLGIAGGNPQPLVIEVRNGAPPFTFLANGLPIGRAAFARSETWQPDGAGFVTLAVIDGQGRSSRVTVFVE
ncbi:MAG: penicillin-binding protein 1C [Bauldia sp.]